MTEAAGLMRGLIRDALSKGLKPIIIANNVFESYYKCYDYNNMLFILSVAIQDYRPIDSDFAVHIINYEDMTAVMTGVAAEEELSPTIDTTGVCETSLRNLLVKCQEKNYLDHQIGLTNDNFFRCMKDQDYSSTTSFKLKTDVAQTQLIPPIIKTVWAYTSYANITELIFALKDIPTLFDASDVPSEVYTIAQDCANKKYMVNRGSFV
jgi:hypothetical protein